ncbi:hypothetical protein ACRAWG_35600 [Methylobacterium sp. P31]
MRYQDLLQLNDDLRDRDADHVISIFARRDQLKALLSMTMNMDVCMRGEPRPILGSGVAIDYACRDAGVALEFLERWTAYCDVGSRF